ncbi:MAG: hypothetical protein ACPGWR_12410 [Ardenticatenaceae bacterium]
MKKQQAFGLFLLLMGLTVAYLVVGSVVEGEGPDVSTSDLSTADVSTIQATEFGMTFINSAELPSSSARVERGISTGAKLDRLPLYWNFIEPSGGELDWSGQDAALRGNEEQGLGTLAILLNTSPLYWPEERRVPAEMPRIGDGMRQLLEQGPERGAEECIVQGPPAPTGLYNPIFADGSDNPAPGKATNADNPWANFVEQIVNRYRPGGTAGLNVRHWEIWNEPDLCHFWGGTPQEYARLLKVAYLVIKNIDPQATVVWGGLALYGPRYQNGANFLNEMLATIQNDPLAAAHNGFSDAAAIHQYSNVANSYYFTLYVQDALAATAWPNKPIWVTESGVPVCDAFPGPACPSPYRANAEEQASYMWLNVAYTRLANNNAPIFHFQLHDDGGNECRQEPPADGFGLFTNEPDAHCVPHQAIARPAYTAFQLATQYFAHTEVISDHTQDGHIRQLTFYHPETNESRLLLWSTDGRDGVVNVPATGKSALRLSPDGSQQTIYPVNGSYQIALQGAIARDNPLEVTYPIGGKPYLLIERDLLAPTATMNELPTVSPPSFNLTWEASDIGTGVESVTILFQVGDNTSWQTWLSNLPASGSATFTGQVGSLYRFAAQATDRAGNSNPPLIAMADTFVNNGSRIAQINGQVQDMKGDPAPWALVSIGQAGLFANETGHFTVTVPVGEWDMKVQNKMQRRGLIFHQDATYSLLLPPNNNPVVNGTFEQKSLLGIFGWEEDGPSLFRLEQVPLSQDHYVRLASTFVPDPDVPGNQGSNGSNSTIWQTLTVPAGKPTLALIYQVESAETGDGKGACQDSDILHDKFEIIVEQDGQQQHIHCQETSSDWQYGFFDLSAYAGQQITLIFNVYETSPNRRTSALIDLVTIGQSPQLNEPTLTYMPIIPKGVIISQPNAIYLPIIAR